MFYPNRCTDILATCDGGLIKQLQTFFKQGVDKELEDHFDQMTGTDTISRKIQRDFIMDSMNTAIEKISTAGVRSIAERCGAVFEFCASLEQQFHKVKLLGYSVDGVEEKLADGTFRYKNIFEGFDEAKSTEERKLWKEAEKKRRLQKSIKKKPKNKKKRKSEVKKKKKSRKKRNKDSKNKRRKSEKKLSPRKKPKVSVADVSTSPEEEKGPVVLLPVVREGSHVSEPVAEEGGAVDQPRTKLRGGQISFYNRKVRTMNVLASLSD